MAPNRITNGSPSLIQRENKMKGGEEEGEGGPLG